MANLIYDECPALELATTRFRGMVKQEIDP
jgi:hypothetical protein